MKEKIKHFFALTLAAFLVTSIVVQVRASTISELEQQQQKHQTQLNEITNQITEMEDEQAILEEEISDLDSEIINMFTSIELLEEEIEEKKDVISEVEAQIVIAQEDYEKAKQEEEEQYEAMKIRIQYMYEKGETSYLQMFLEAESFSDMLNKADYIEQLYEYDRNQLQLYEETRIAVEELQAKLEEEKSTLETEKAELEDSKKELEDQKAYLDVMLAKKKEESSNYDTQIAQARQQAAIYKTKIKEEKKRIKALQEEERKKAEEALKAQQTAADGKNAAGSSGSSGGNSGGNSGGSSGGSVTPPVSTGGSATGQQIASYACQFVGNPYVSGGTSLTNGADCSGFTYRVYSDFGYSIPRTSYAQRNVGTGVDYANAQPGDIICYSGHVAIYIGNGKIVHASTASTGIKISNAQYREILSVRRIV